MLIRLTLSNFVWRPAIFPIPLWPSHRLAHFEKTLPAPHLSKADRPNAIRQKVNSRSIFDGFPFSENVPLRDEAHPDRSVWDSLDVRSEVLTRLADLTYPIEMLAPNFLL